MTVVRYEPWALIDRLQRELDGAFAANARDSAWAPAVDVFEEQDRFVVRADLPGVTAEQIKITAEQGVLSLRGERSFEKRDDQARYQRVERVSGKFARSFTLPENVQAEAIKAQFLNGVLELSIPKAQKPEPRHIAVQAA
jgi:HSP20 family protein